jgi:hypothetical protein
MYLLRDMALSGAGGSTLGSRWLKIASRTRDGRIIARQIDGGSFSILFFLLVLVLFWQQTVVCLLRFGGIFEFQMLFFGFDNLRERKFHS